MIRAAQSSTALVSRTVAYQRLPKNVGNAITHRRPQSSQSKVTTSILEGDAGQLGTHLHHSITFFLAIATPVMFLVPDCSTDGVINTSFGVLLSANVAAHSWIGLNYVLRDYVPKVSMGLLGPARILSAGVGIVTFLGMSKIAIQSPGGIKGAVKKLWNPTAAPPSSMSSTSKKKTMEDK